MAKQHANSKNEQGYILLAVMLLMTLMLIALSLELPRISQQIKRGKEEELVHRGEQYKIAIKRFLRKNGRYPASLEQLDNTNQIRYLRKHYKDPMTGKDEWRILHVGEVQLNAGNGQLQAAGGGGNNLLASPGSTGTNSGFGSGGFGSGTNSGFGNAGTSGIVNTPGTTGSTGSTGSNSPGPTIGPSTSSGPGSSSFGSGNVQFGGAGIMGVTSTSKEKSIKELNGKDHYNEWLFVYDPRLDTTRPGATGAGGVGTPIVPGGQGGLGTGGIGGPGAGSIGGPGPGGTGGPGGSGSPGPGGTNPP